MLTICIIRNPHQLYRKIKKKTFWNTKIVKEAFLKTEHSHDKLSTTVDEQLNPIKVEKIDENSPYGTAYTFSLTWIHSSYTVCIWEWYVKT